MIQINDETEKSFLKLFRHIFLIYYHFRKIGVVKWFYKVELI